jgi:hypothetical protein
MQKFTIDIPLFVKVKHVQYGDEDTKYHYSIYNLENEFLPNADLKNRIYRSAIMSGNKLLALAPAKSLPNDSFVSANKFSVNKFSANKVCANEIIEGTMINMFWDSNLGQWEIATKKGIGGKYFFFRNKYEGELEEPEQKTFREMFLDSFALNNLPFDKSYSYSFVMQHPSNHIVLPIDKHAVYLVHTYKFAEDNTYAYVNPKSHPNYEDFVKMGVKFARDFVLAPGKTLEEQFVDSTNHVLDHIPNLEEALSNPLNQYTNIGVMITDQETGLRTAYYNKMYLEAKTLRGNNPNLHYQYLMLRKIGKVSEFLRYFPQYRKHFNKFLEHFTFFMERIHKMYWEVHVKKTLSVMEIPEKHDKYFVEKLHYEVFLPRHRENKKFFINQKEVIKFLDGEKVMVPI